MDTARRLDGLGLIARWRRLPPPHRSLDVVVGVIVDRSLVVVMAVVVANSSLPSQVRRAVCSRGRPDRDIVGSPAGAVEDIAVGCRDRCRLRVGSQCRRMRAVDHMARIGEIDRLTGWGDQPMLGRFGFCFEALGVMLG